jgi:hypothetical protein
MVRNARRMARSTAPSPGSDPLEFGRGHSQQLRPQQRRQWLGQNTNLAQLIVIPGKRDHRSAKLRAPFLIWVTRDVLRSKPSRYLASTRYKTRRETSLRCQFVPPSIAWLTQQLRQLGEVHHHAPRLVARQPIWSPSGATHQYVRNRGISGSARLALETTLMTLSEVRVLNAGDGVRLGTLLAGSI